MNGFSSKMKEMSEYAFPQGLHGRIMRRIYFFRLRGPLLTIFFLLAVNAALSAWHVWIRMMQLNTLAIITSMFEVFEASADFFINITQNISQVIPIMSLSVFTLNAALLCYVAFLLLKTRHANVYA